MQVRSALLVLVIAFGLIACVNLEFLNGNGDGPRFGHPRYHTVKPGETLYSIAWSYGYDYQTVAKWNNIKPPYTIFVGQRIRVAPPADEQYAGNDRLNNNNTSDEDSSASDNNPKDNKNRWAKSAIDWQWPTNGVLIEGFSSTNKGLNISGQQQQPVYAAADGVVVYSGSGLRGYGNLIIIKHNEVYLSAYAHNQEIFVKEGTKVKKGQKIASMGNTDSDKVMLHFEIRRDGKPVDPIVFLPKRN